MVLGIPRGNWYVEEGDARLRRRTNLIDYTTALQVVEEHAGTTIVQNAPQSMLPFTVSCPLPQFDKWTQTTYHALTCKGCVLACIKPDLTRHNGDYTREELLEHVKECEEAKKLWAASECGTKDIGHLENRLSSGGVSRMATGGTLLRDRGHTRMLVVMHNTSIPGNSKRDRLGKANK